MCGIAGIINFQQPIKAESRKEMLHLLGGLQHRGPDNAAFQSVSQMALFGSTRLRITDAFSEDADMPMDSSCGRYTIVYNGEIYNHRELRRELPDYPYKTESDTETLLAAYANWGMECLSRLEGMFAFAIFDSRTRECFFAVDPSGQKFFYYLQDKNSFVFASEIQALITDPWREKNWNFDAISEFISQRMILGGDTHIQEISRLEAGTYMILKPDGRKTIKRYYTVQVGRQDYTELSDIKNSIRDAAREACHRTFNLEVPYGHFLSGGIDSAIVTYFAREAGLDLKTYSIGFAPFQGEHFDLPSVFNEFEYSRYLADHFGTDHTEITIGADEYAEHIDSWINICGEPLDSSEAPMLMALFKNVQADHKVVFCGSGPDEAFDGYGHGAALQGIHSGNLSENYYDRFNWSFDVDLNRLLINHQDTRSNVIRKMDYYLSLYDHIDPADIMQRTQLLNLHGRCTTYEYRQMDVISMAHSIEARSPLADTGLTRAAFDFQSGLKNYNGVPKGIFKEAFRGMLPDKIIDRPKTGFPTPIEFWFSNLYEDRLQQRFYKGHPLFDLGILDEKYFRHVLAQRRPEYRSIIYRLYILAGLIERQSDNIGIKTQQNEKRYAY